MIAEEPVARAVTRGGEGVAAGTTAGAFSMTVTKSASEQLNTALPGAATECPGGSKTNLAISGAANTCPTSTLTLGREQAVRKPRLSLASTEAPKGRKEHRKESALWPAW